MRVLHLIVAVVVIPWLPAVAAAQTGRATGAVIDTNGDPIQGAVVRATNPQAARGEITSTTDDKGRFAMIGLRAGVWGFVAEAPGYMTMEASVPIRAATSGPPMRFVLQRTPEPIPGALTNNLGEDIARAQAMRAQGRSQQALELYESLRQKNPKLTALNLVIAGLYRQQAEAAQDAAARRTLMQRAMVAYAEAVKADADNDRARLELGATQLAAGETAAGRTTFQEIIAARPGSPAAAEAAVHLQGIRE